MTRRRLPHSPARRVFQEQLQHGGHEVDGGDATIDDRLCEVRAVPVTAGFSDDQLGPNDQRPEELPHRYVEAEGCLLQDLVGVTEREVVLHPQDAVDDGALR